MSAVEFDRALIERYGGRGPRYTSYPTAVQFHSGFAEAEYREQVRRADAADSAAPLSIYVHIPFCHSLCYYCGCSKIVTRHRERAERYLRTLALEIELQAELFTSGRIVSQLHLGGGTPTYLDPDQMRRLMDTLRARFSLRSDGAREFSIEIDPRTVAPDDLRELAACGFNRISMGVQDFDPAVQKAINREQSFSDTAALVQAARSAGFGSVSLDLIYGLPLQTVAGFDRTLERILDIRPDRVAVYSYAHLPQMFRAQKLIHEDQLPAPEVKLDILRCTIDRLTAAGYVYIGMDHFALADDELVQSQVRGDLQRNFQGYSTHAHCDLIGLGVTAIGHIDGCYSQNAKELETYTRSVEQGRLPIVRGLVMDQDDRLRNVVIQQIMCLGRLDFASLGERFGIDVPRYFAVELERLHALQQDGLLALDAGGLTVSGRGRLLLRAIAMVFDRYLADAGTRQRFSKII